MIRPAVKPRQRSIHNQVPLYAAISLVAFLCSLTVLMLLINKGDTLVGLGLVDRVYYVVLVFAGLTAAVFLFGVLPSSAAYEGRLLGGSLKLGGAIVGAALVVVGGYLLVPQVSTFPLTVYVHGEGGPQDTVLRNSGVVILEIGPDPRREPIGDNGQAYFPAIPTSFRHKAVLGWVESDAYESVDPGAKRQLDGTSLYLKIRRKIRHFKLAGTVSDAAGNPLSGVSVVLPEYSVEGRTNGYGRFELQVVEANQRTVSLLAQKKGYQTAHLSPTLGDAELNFVLKRTP